MGAYALIPYMALWSPKQPAEQLPPPKEELVGQPGYTRHRQQTLHWQQAELAPAADRSGGTAAGGGAKAPCRRVAGRAAAFAY